MLLNVRANVEEVKMALADCGPVTMGVMGQIWE